MRSLFILGLLLLPSSVFAALQVTEDALNESNMNLVTLMVSLLGENAALALITLAVIGFLWAQLRQIIPTEMLTKLPLWLVWLLELLAANKGQAVNALQYVRKRQVTEADKQ